MRVVGCTFQFLLLLAVAFSTTSRCDGDDETAKRPNILLIVVDDMGYSDIGPFGAEIRTRDTTHLPRDA